MTVTEWTASADSAGDKKERIIKAELPMPEIIVEALSQTPVEQQRVELVERKGSVAAASSRSAESPRMK